MGAPRRDPPGPSERPLPDLPDGRLTDGVVVLRRLGPDDTEQTYRLHSDPEVAASRVPPGAPAREEIERRCAGAEGQWLVGTAAAMTILDGASGDFVGNCTLNHDQPANGQAMIGYSLLPQWRGRGYATRAVRLLARWGFDHVGLSRLWAGTLPENAASQRVLDKAGFRREGLLRGRLPARPAAGSTPRSTACYRRIRSADEGRWCGRAAQADTAPAARVGDADPGRRDGQMSSEMMP